MEPCPHCGNELEGLGYFCWTCKRYADTPEYIPADTLPDSRREDERKADARPAVEALGWWILDLEQGWRPFACPKCKNKLPGGSRVTLGLADWLLLKDGRAAFVEWKSGTGKQSGDQKAFEHDCDVTGIPYRVCRTTEQVVKFLKEI